MQWGFGRCLGKLRGFIGGWTLDMFGQVPIRFSGYGNRVDGVRRVELTLLMIGQDPISLFWWED